MHAALDELTQRCVNPVRRHLFWRADVRSGAKEFRRFRAAMQDLVMEVHISPLPVLPSHSVQSRPRQQSLLEA